jgi:hypothetical protein
MEANVNKARRITRVALILGAVAAAVIASAACAEETTTDKSGQALTIGPVANDPGIEMPVDATPSPDAIRAASRSPARGRSTSSTRAAPFTARRWRRS